MRPLFLQAGVFHYFRLPHRDLWRPALTRLRLSGFNAVVLPIPWAYHSPAPGFYDFTGPRDLEHVMDVIEEVGLWSIPHLGPWVGSRLDAGGIPAWVFRSAGMAPSCEAGAASISYPLRRHLSTWWSHLFKVLRDRDHLLFLMLDPGRCANGTPLPGMRAALVELVEELWGGGVPWSFLDAPGPGEPPPARPSWVEVDAAEGLDVPEDVDGKLAWVNVEVAPPGRRHRASVSPLPATYPREALTALMAKGCRGYALNPVHEGVTWGWWAAPANGAGPAAGIPIPEGWTPSAQSLNVRRLCLTAETFADLWVEGRAEPNAYASPPEVLWAARGNADGTVAVVGTVNDRPGSARVSLGTPDRMLVTEDLALPRHGVRLLPLHWAVAGGRVLTTTMEPILTTSVAGRHLLILLNEDGGTVTLSDDFRVRHQRGPVAVARADRALTVHMGDDRLLSVLLAGPEGSLQLLALETSLANRVWPLDDRWRTSPHRRAVWNPQPEEPARGVVIGPDFVLPQADGGYRFLAGGRGLGYRWGPWRGSDPRTWLAPVPWRASRSLTLPALGWQARRGAPEVLPGYDDQAWRSVAVGASLASAALDVGYGFTWYRAYFSGSARSVVMRSPDACDLFLNGVHVASLSAPPEAPVTTKRIPLPRRHLRSQNVLAFLVEHAGRPPAWDLAAEPHGILACELEGGQISAWRIRPGLSGSVKHQGFAGFGDWDWVPDAGTADIVWHRAVFDPAIPDEVEVPLFLRVENTPRKAYLYLNGRMIGRTGQLGGGSGRFWLPEGILKRREENAVMIVQWTRGANPGLGRVRLESGTSLQWHREGRVH